MDVQPAQPSAPGGTTALAPLRNLDLSNTTELTPDQVEITRWLEIYFNRSPHTFRAYLREAQRWLAFLESTKGYSETLIPGATEQDVSAYQEALGKPELNRGLTKGSSAPWGPTLLPESILVRRGLKTQPFQRVASQRSINRALATLSAMYRFLALKINPADVPYVSHNPVVRIYKVQGSIGGMVDRYFTTRIYHEMHETLSREQGKDQSNEAAALNARRIWVITALFGLWLRASEACSITMSSFFKENGVWKLHVQGKGRKNRTIEVTDGNIKALNTYRSSIGLASLKARDNEDYSVITSVRAAKGTGKRGVPITPTTLFREVKAIATLTAQRIESGDTDIALEDQAMVASHLRKISPHWFRHSGASVTINEADYDISSAAQRLGHAQVNTTATMYHHKDIAKNRDALEALETSINSRTKGDLF